MACPYGFSLVNVPEVAYSVGMEPTDTKDTPRSLRARLGLTQGELALRAAGVSLRTIKRFERGQSVSTDHLASLAGALEVDASTLLVAIRNERTLRARRAGRAA